MRYSSIDAEYDLDLAAATASKKTTVATVSIKHYLLTLLLLVLLFSWLPYFDYNRLLPPEADSVALECSLQSLEVEAYKSVEARITMPHLVREGEWSETATLLVPSVLLKRHVRCLRRLDRAERQYVYNQLLANISGLVDMSTVLLTERARYEQTWIVWDYGDGAMRGLREYRLDEHALSLKPIDRDEDWLTVYCALKGAILLVTVPLAWCLLQAKFFVQRRLSLASRQSTTTTPSY